MLGKETVHIIVDRLHSDEQRDSADDAELSCKIVNVENLTTLPYSKDDRYPRFHVQDRIHIQRYRATLFCDHITNFSTNQVAANISEEPDKLADLELPYLLVPCR